MALADWLSLISICLLGALSPGPSLMVILACTSGNGRAAGVLASVGHGLGVFGYALAAATGLSASARRIVAISDCGHGSRPMPRLAATASARSAAAAVGPAAFWVTRASSLDTKVWSAEWSCMRWSGGGSGDGEAAASRARKRRAPARARRRSVHSGSVAAAAMTASSS